MSDELGKVDGVWASERPYAQDATLGPTVRERVEADRANTQSIRAAQQADPEGHAVTPGQPGDGVIYDGDPALDSPRAPQPKAGGLVEFITTNVPSETYSVKAEGPVAVLPVEAEARKGIPIVSGVLDYFPAALAEVAKVSKAGNDQHNPGEALHWARGKSTDQADTLVRHLMERGGLDVDGQRHSAKAAWRALALLQMELEAEGAPMARGAS